ncbi:hypothetical protein EMCRGX_G024406 [Ephydatia muelleri]
MYSQDQAEQPEAVDYDFHLPVRHPFVAYFSHKTNKAVLVDRGSAINKYYKPEFFDTLMQNWLPMAPFWSGLMLGDLQRHKQEISNGSQLSRHKPPKPFSQKIQINEQSKEKTTNSRSRLDVQIVQQLPCRKIHNIVESLCALLQDYL